MSPVAFTLLPLHRLESISWIYSLTDLFGKKVPYVDSPQLNAIRHKKFRTQKVLFRAVPTEYSRNRDIPNFRTMVQTFRVRQTTVQIVYVRNLDISNFRTMAQSSGNRRLVPGTTLAEPSCGTELCGTRAEQCGAAARTTCGSARCP